MRQLLPFGKLALTSGLALTLWPYEANFVPRLLFLTQVHPLHMKLMYEGPL